MHGWKKQNSAPQIKNIPKKNFRSHVNVLARFFSAPANGIYFAENLPAAPPEKIWCIFLKKINCVVRSYFYFFFF